MPTSPQARRTALENKNRLEEIRRRQKEGHAPTNEQVKYFINEGEEALRAEERKLPSEGRKIVEDTERVLEDTKQMLEAKNKDEKLQRIGEHSMKAYKKTSVRDPTLKPSKEEQDVVRQLLEDTKDLIRILVSSKNFRKTAIEFLYLVREIAQKEKEEIKIPEAEKRSKEENKQIMKEKVRAKFREENISSLKEKASAERRRSFEERLNDLLEELDKSYTTQEFMRHLFTLLDHLSTHGKTIREKGKAEATKSKTEMDSVWYDLRGFMAQFTSPETLHDLGHSFKEVRTLLREDPELRHVAQEWRHLSTRHMEESHKYTRDEIKDLVDRTRTVIHQKRNAGPIAGFLRALQEFVEDIHKDPYRQKLSKDIKILVRDLLYDSQGNFSINDRALSQIRSIIVPSLVDQLKYIALPTIESDTKKQYVLVRDVVLKISDILPDHIDIRMKSKADLATKHLELEKPHNKMKFNLRDVEIHIYQADVYVKRHSFPKIEDDLKVNVDVYGKKNLFKWKLSTVTKRDARTGRHYAIFKVDSTFCKIDHLHIKATQGKHDTMVNIMSTILKPLIKKNMEREIEKNLYQGLQKICNVINDLSRRTPYLREKTTGTLKKGTERIKHTAQKPHKLEKAVPKKEHKPTKEPTATYKEPTEVIYVEREEMEEPEVELEKPGLYAEEKTKVKTPEGAEYESRTDVYSEQSY